MMLPELKPLSDSAYKRMETNDKKRTITSDISKINEILSSGKEDDLQELHLLVDGKYGAYVPDWHIGVYGYIENVGFNYELIDVESLVHNLKLMRSKLEGYAMGFEKRSQRTYATNNNVNVNVSNSNEINISVSFEDVRQQIEDMTSLTDEQTKEILNKITEIEEVVKSNESKKSKWEKVKPVLVWLADKSFDVGMALLPLLLKLGGQ